MEKLNEKAVTKLLSSNEIIHLKDEFSFVSNPICNLGDFLQNVSPEPSPYEGKYIFIR